MGEIIVFRDFEEWCCEFAKSKSFRVFVDGEFNTNAKINQLIRVKDGYLVGISDIESEQLSFYKLENLSFSEISDLQLHEEDQVCISCEELSFEELWVREMLCIGSQIQSYDKEKFPTLNFVFKDILITLRNTYGVVLSQLQKEYKSKFGTEKSPEPIVLISYNESYRKVFENLLKDVLGRYENPGSAPVSSLSKKEMSDEALLLAWELGEKRNDNSKGYNATFRHIYTDMDCNWDRLKDAYQARRGLTNPPRKFDLLINDPILFGKFRQSANKLLAKSA